MTLFVPYHPTLPTGQESWAVVPESSVLEGINVVYVLGLEKVWCRGCASSTDAGQYVYRILIGMEAYASLMLMSWRRVAARMCE
jgi:hypothetical protein